VDQHTIDVGYVNQNNSTMSRLGNITKFKIAAKYNRSMVCEIQ